MAYPWATGAWAVGALASGSWLVASSNAGVSWATNSWATSTWAAGSWQAAWAQTGTYSFNGQPVTFSRIYKMASAVGSFTLTGGAVNPTLQAIGGSYTVSGNGTTLTANTYRITQVNTIAGQVVDNSTGVQIQGTFLTGTNSVKIEYAKGGALSPGSWGPTVWATGAWADGTSGIVSTSLTNVIVVGPTLVTADMFDVETSNIPFSDVNHVQHRISISTGTKSNYYYVSVVPQAFQVVGTVDPADAITTAGQSIFSGLTLNVKQQVLLPVTIDGKNVTWEQAVSGNVTGRFTLASGPVANTDLTIPIWDDTLGWDVINVTVKDISAINTILTASVGAYVLSGQDAGKEKQYVLGIAVGSYVYTGQTAALTLGSAIVPSSLTLGTTINQALISDGMTVTRVLGMADDIVQTGAVFNVTGVGFATDVDVVLVDILGNAIDCPLVGITNSAFSASVPVNAGALSSPVKLYVGDYQRDGGGNIVIVSGAPVATTSRNVNRSVQIAIWTSAKLTLASTLDNTSFIQAHVLPVDTMISATLLGSSTPIQSTYSLTVNGLRSTTTLAANSLIQNYVNVANNATSATTLSNVTLAQHYNLIVNGLTSTTLLGATSIHDNSLVVNGLTLASQIGSPTLTQANTLAVNGLTLSQLLGNISLTQHSQLTVAGLTSATTLSNSTSVFVPLLGVGNLNSTTTLSSPSLTQSYTLSVNGLISTTLLSNGSVNNSYTLTVNDLTSATTLEEPTLDQRSLLDVNDLFLHTRLGRSAAIARTSLVVDDMSLITTLDESRAKTIADPIFVTSIQSKPAISGRIHANK